VVCTVGEATEGLKQIGALGSYAAHPRRSSIRN
jgi:hypothetical protein